MSDPNALVAGERVAREQMAQASSNISHWAAERRRYLHLLKQELGTWPKVAEATGQNLATVHKAVYQPKKGTTE